jgi:hypothetical protein
MLAIRAYLLVDYQVNAEATPDSIPPAHGTRPRHKRKGSRVQGFCARCRYGSGTQMRLRRTSSEPVEEEQSLDHGSPAVGLVEETNGAAAVEKSAVRRRPSSLAALLREAGIASEAEISEALEEGNRSGETLAELVVSRGWASEQQLAHLLADQWGLAAVDPGALSLDPLAVAKLEPALASKLGGFPVWFDTNGLVVAIAEPTEQRLAAFRKQLGEVSFVVVPPSTLQELLDSRLFASRQPAPTLEGHLQLLDAWTPNHDSGHSPTTETDTPSTHTAASEQPGQEPNEQSATIPANELRPTETAPLPATVPSPLADQLHTLITTELHAFEQAYHNAESRLEAQERELATLRQTHEQDLETIRHLNAELGERDRRIHALRQKVADLRHTLDD